MKQKIEKLGCRLFSGNEDIFVISLYILPSAKYGSVDLNPIIEQLTLSLLFVATLTDITAVEAVTEPIERANIF